MKEDLLGREVGVCNQEAAAQPVAGQSQKEKAREVEKAQKSKESGNNKPTGGKSEESMVVEGLRTK